MKKKLLLFCALPCLLNAQGDTKNVTKEKTFFRQLQKSQQTGEQMMLRAGADTNLPDTIYTYWGEEKVLVCIGAIEYDENGRIVQEKGRLDSNGDGIINQNDVEYKTDYTYIQKDDLLETQEVYSKLFDEEWVEISKTVSIQKTPDIQLEYYMYDNTKEGWLLWSKTVAAEFNDRGLPIAYNDTTYGDPMRMEIIYDENDLYKEYITFIPGEEEESGNEWLLFEKAELTYDDNKKLVKDIHHDYDAEDEEWYFSYMTEYTYDEKGNLTSAIETGEYGIEEAIYYTNIYSSTVSNDPVFSVQSAIYPNPVSDMLNIVVEGTQQAIITLVSANGSIVVQQKVQQLITTIPVSSLAKGYYFLTVQTVQGAKTHKVIIK